MPARYLFKQFTENSSLDFKNRHSTTWEQIIQSSKSKNMARPIFVQASDSIIIEFSSSEDTDIPWWEHDAEVEEGIHLIAEYLWDSLWLQTIVDWYWECRQSEEERKYARFSWSYWATRRSSHSGTERYIKFPGAPLRNEELLLSILVYWAQLPPSNYLYSQKPLIYAFLAVKQAGKDASYMGVLLVGFGVTGI